MVDQRKNSMELYGYDFMIDDSFNPWLIEINVISTFYRNLLKMIIYLYLEKIHNNFKNFLKK